MRLMASLKNFIKDSLVDSYHFRLLAKYPALFMTSEGKRNAARMLAARPRETTESSRHQPDNSNKTGEPPSPS
ncbi:MAG: hypothetical protein FOGNACKC_03367 [Anaerolineae bacterium]|nr:hypothetical protein [Anaerolineae bacterium]